MDNIISEQIAELKKQGKIGFMGHIIAGFPDYNTSFEAACGISEGSANFLEVQFPFSDPTADGPTIEGACYKAIANGFTIDFGFKLVKELSDNIKSSILIMTYANIIFKYGIEQFIAKAKECGARGVIIPDLPIDADEKLIDTCKHYDIVNILIAAPGATRERIKKLSEIGTGFLYTVTRRGITGKKSDITKETQDWLTFVKNNSKLPIAIGFGIQTHEQVAQLKPYCDIVVVGSLFVRIIDECSKNGENIRNKLKESVSVLL